MQRAIYFMIKSLFIKVLHTSTRARVLYFSCTLIWSSNLEHSVYFQSHIALNCSFYLIYFSTGKNVGKINHMKYVQFVSVCWQIIRILIY